jgi:hypothetical protein
MAGIEPPSRNGVMYRVTCTVRNCGGVVIAGKNTKAILGTQILLLPECRSLNE